MRRCVSRKELHDKMFLMTTEGYTRLHWLRGASTAAAAKMIARKKREIRTLYGNEVVKDFL